MIEWFNTECYIDNLFNVINKLITKGSDITGATIREGFESNFHIPGYTKRFLQDGNVQYWYGNFYLDTSVYFLLPSPGSSDGLLFCSCLISTKCIEILLFVFRVLVEYNEISYTVPFKGLDFDFVG